MLAQAVMQILADAPLLPAADFQNRLFEPLAFGDVDTRDNNLAPLPLSPPGNTVLDHVIRRREPSASPYPSYSLGTGSEHSAESLL